LEWFFNITDNDIQELARLIKTSIQNGFEVVHLSKNLMDTIEIDLTAEGFLLTIPAEMYDIQKFRDKGVIVYSGVGSYAQEVDVTGGFSGKHKNYVENAIQEAIIFWLNKLGLSGKVRSV
jgi:isopentenyl phosphate kinase